MRFCDRLNEAMIKLNISQVQVHRLTGISKSAISQYCSGKLFPSDERKTAIAEAMGLPGDYFNGNVKAEDQEAGRLQRLTIKDVSELMGLSRPTIARGLQDGVFPWGYAVRGSGDGWVYWINAKRFAEIEGVNLDARTA